MVEVFLEDQYWNVDLKTKKVYYGKGTCLIEGCEFIPNTLGTSYLHTRIILKAANLI